MTNSPKKRGRPPFLWRAPEGKKFVTAVALRKHYSVRPITTARAICLVLQQPEFARLRKKYGNKIPYLKKQISDANKFWNPFARLHKLEIDSVKREEASLRALKQRLVEIENTEALQRQRLINSFHRRFTGTQNELAERKVRPKLFS